MACYGFHKMQKDIIVNVMFSMIIGDRLSCFSFLFLLFLYSSLTFCFWVYVCDYRFKLMENKADEDEKDDEVRDKVGV